MKENYGSYRCPTCDERIAYVGRDPDFGGSRVICDPCNLRWSAGRSMTGPETVFFPVGSEWEPEPFMRAQPYTRFERATELFIIGTPILMLAVWIVFAILGAVAK